MELRDYIRAFRKNWFVIVLVTLIGIGTAAAYSFTRTPMYSSQSTVFVSTQTGSTVQDLTQGQTFTQQRVTTYVNLVTKPIVLNPVIADLSLNATAAQLANDITTSNTLNTTLIGITVQNASPTLAAEIANALADSLTNTVQSIDASSGSGASPVKLTRVQDALPDTSPVSPKTPLNLILGALIGLLVGIAISVLRTALDNKVRSLGEVSTLTDRPVIGVIPFDSKARERPIILQADPQNPRSEAFRALRTNLQFLGMDGGNSFVITSSIPSEGKTTTAINLAIAIADAGLRVALIDTDLRKPKVAEYLGIEGGVGLTDVLIGRASLADVMLPWGKRPLFVLPAGRVPPNPSELLGSPQMARLLEVITADLDIVILDGPPLLPVTDAALLAKSAAGALVVAAAGRVSTGQLQGALTVLDTVGAKIGGIVLSMVPTKGAYAYGYGYGYGYNYGYGYGYGGQAETAKNARKRKKTRQRAATDGDASSPTPGTHLSRGERRARGE